jgi:prevent-host-death family protein
VRRINIHEAKTHLSRLVEEAARGEAFVIAKAGKPMVKVVPLEPEKVDTSKRLGFLRGRITVPENFDTFMQDEIIAMFYGEDDEDEGKD